MFGCLGRLVALALVLIVGAALWFFREPLLERLRGMREDAPPTSAELAQAATLKLERLANEEAGSSVALSGIELQALLDERLRAFLPPYVLDPTVELDDGRVLLGARLPVDEVPRLEDELGAAAGFLPDTANVSAGAQLVPVDATHVALAFDEMSIARVPLPKRLIPRVVQRLRPAPQPGVPADALALPLPAGVRAAYVRGDSLVLVAAGRAAAP